MRKDLYKRIFLFIGMLCSSIALADLSVNAKSWPKQLPEDDYGPQNYYGSGQTKDFHTAITGKGSAEVTNEEQGSIAKILPVSEVNRWYIKAGIYKGTTKLNSIKNISTNNTLSPFILTAAKAKKDVNGGQIGAGYIFDKYRIDVDYIFGTNVDYNQTPLFTLASGAGWPNITSTVTGQHLIANAYYDFEGLFLFKPFIGASVGLGMNKASSNFTQVGGVVTAGAGLSKSTIAFDYGIQFGSRIKIYKMLSASASYRYLSLGSVKWQDASQNLMLKGKRSFNGFCLDLIYLI